ncbi:amidohydrolase family protein [Legionella sp. W05-934-2]|uniref:amidohydrolase family protein n=1 Tax=Legionella sp. W05-934-2 TaxID=1198649 RepID=UPI00346373CD
MKKRYLTLAIFLISSVQANPILLKAKRYLDVQAGKYVSPAAILIENDTITAINPQHVPKSAQIIEKPQLTLLPGLMDMHVHVHFEFTPNYALEYIQTDAAMATLNGVKNAQTLLMAGFTTIRDISQGYPGNTLVDVALAKASEEGIIAAPPYHSCGPCVKHHWRTHGPGDGRQLSQCSYS